MLLHPCLCPPDGMPDCLSYNMEPLQPSLLAAPTLNPPVFPCPLVLLNQLFQLQHFNRKLQSVFGEIKEM